LYVEPWVVPKRLHGEIHDVILGVVHGGIKKGIIARYLGQMVEVIVSIVRPEANKLKILRPVRLLYGLTNIRRPRLVVRWVASSAN